MDTPSGHDGVGTSGTVHYPKVVLVTGACRFLGGYLTARLAQNPLINGVIAVDAIAPSKDMLRRMGRGDLGTDRLEPAVRGLPEGAVGASSGAQVDL